jgi:hypothetical protein
LGEFRKSACKMRHCVVEYQGYVQSCKADIRKLGFLGRFLIYGTIIFFRRRKKDGN